jgi:hypothetical protein
MKRTAQSRAVGVGTMNEKRCEDELTSYGYRTWRTRRQRFGNMDMFGLFDVVGCHNNPYVAMRFVQVKTNRVDAKTIKTIKDFKMPVGCYKEVWVWKSKEEKWKKIDCN